VHQCAKCRRNRSNRAFTEAEIFQDGGRRHAGFLKFLICNGRNGQEGRSALVFQISSESLELHVAEIWRFSIFQDVGHVHHLEFSKFEIFNVCNGQECRTASPCQISSKSNRGRDMCFNIMLVWPEYAYSRPFLGVLNMVGVNISNLSSL